MAQNLNNYAALVIDDDPSNQSVNYQHASIDNTCLIGLTLDEMNDVFQNNKSEIFQLQTKNCMTFILQNGREISLHEYQNGVRPVFLKIITPELYSAGTDILIGMTDPNQNYYAMPHMVWENDRVQLQDYLIDTKNISLMAKRDIASSDLDGYKNTMTLFNNASKIVNSRKDTSLLGKIKKLFNKKDPISDYIPAIHYCIQQKINIGADEYQGYLPAIGQLNICAKYCDLILYVLSLGGNVLYGFNNVSFGQKFYWSSTEYSNYQAWSLFDGIMCEDNTKGNKLTAFPFFKKLD